MQTRLHPCEICGEPAVKEIEITPAVYQTRGDGDSKASVMIKRPVSRWVCELHAERAEDQRGWQEREKDHHHRLTVEAKERLRRDQLDIFGDTA